MVEDMGPSRFYVESGPNRPNHLGPHFVVSNRLRKPLRVLVLALLCFGVLSGHIADVPPFDSRFVYPVTTDPSQDLRPLCEAIGVNWPPERLRLVAFKEEKILEVWAARESGPFRRVITYAVTAASGVAGPKRREGDLQVPEGKYRLTDLNPNSRF